MVQLQYLLFLFNLKWIWWFNNWEVPVPIIDILFGASELIPQAHANHIVNTIKQCGHPSKALDPEVWVEVLVSKEAIVIRVATTPGGLAHMIIKYDLHIIGSKASHHSLKLN